METVIVGGWPKPNERDVRKFFGCEYWVCACGYGEHASPHEQPRTRLSMGGHRPPWCPHCGAEMRVLERHWHKKG